jgi:hypothetical protein
MTEIARPDEYEKWVNYAVKYGRGGTVRSLSWLLAGCPICKQTLGFEVTNDGWAYCPGCSIGFPCEWPISNYALEWLDKNGQHCFMCHGFGFRRGIQCDECGGRISQPILKSEDNPLVKDLDFDSVMINPRVNEPGQNYGLSIDSKLIIGCSVETSEAIPDNLLLLVKKGKMRVRGLVGITNVAVLSLDDLNKDESDE